MTYAYICRDQHEFDLDAPLGEAPESPPCPTCGSPGRRVWATAFHLGYGFNSYGGRVQRSRELQDRFFPGRG
jgi:hypothetical protein